MVIESVSGLSGCALQIACQQRKNAAGDVVRNVYP